MDRPRHGVGHTRAHQKAERAYERTYRRTTRMDRRPRWLPLLNFGIAAVAVIVTCIAIWLVSALGDDEGSSSSSSEEADLSDGDISLDDLEAIEQAQADAPACSDLPGLPTSEVRESTGWCKKDGQMMLLGFANYDCHDGRKLFWNDYGWGYGNGSWQAHSRADGQLVPPQPDVDACIN